LTHLQGCGRNYLASSAFIFTSTDTIAKGRLYPAIHDHQGGPVSKGDMVLNVIAG
jgi:hypothetical protein